MYRKAFWFFRSVFVLSAMLVLSLGCAQAQLGFIPVFVDDFGTEDISDIFQGPDGNIGIGTTSPATKLHVLGPGGGAVVATFEQPSGINFVDLKSATGGLNYGSFLRFVDSGIANAEIRSTANGELRFATSGQERVTVSGAGLAVGGRQVINNTGRWVGDPTGLQGPPGPPGSPGPPGPPGTFAGTFAGATRFVGGPHLFESGNVGIGGFRTGTFRLNVEGSVFVNGIFMATSTKSAVVNTASYGNRNLYAVEAPTVRFVDEGSAKLEGGTARIELDPVFAETIEGDLLVHITPYGPATLYVAERRPNYFVVQSAGGEDVEFAWYVSAYRKGYRSVRLEEVQ